MIIIYRSGVHSSRNLGENVRKWETFNILLMSHVEKFTILNNFNA